MADVPVWGHSIAASLARDYVDKVKFTHPINKSEIFFCRVANLNVGLSVCMKIKPDAAVVLHVREGRGDDGSL